jgi:hypothetical protein
LAEPIVATGARAFTVKTDDGLTTVDLKKGETVLLTSGPPSGDLVIEPVTPQADRLNYYGTRKVAPLAQDAQGNFLATARQAQLNGSTFFLQGKGDMANIGRWTSASDVAVWKLDVRQPGAFRVIASYASTGAGAQFAVEAADSVIKADRKSTGGWDKFQDFELGTLTLPAGAIELRVRSADGKPPTINLRNIVLQRK